MTTLIRVELLKLTTTRLGYGLLATGAALCALFSILEGALAGGKGANVPAPLYTVSGFTSASEAGVWAMLLAAVLGVTVTSGEFRQHTATLTYLTTPARTRVLLAKIGAGAIVGAVFGLAGFIVAFGTVIGYVYAKGYHVPVGDLTIARIGAGQLLASALLAAIGVCVGALVRSQLAGVIGVFVWCTILESLIGGLYHAVWPYLPYTAATTLAGISVGGAAFGPAHGATNGTALPFIAAAALLAALAALTAATAARTTIPRDIT